MYHRAVLLNLPKSQSLDIEFSDITYEVSGGFRKSKKQILHGVSGCFKSGELTAIMGPSGAGKSSLLNILTGFHKKNVNGKISFCGRDGVSSWNEYDKESCYIQQDDMLHPLFTVSEAMTMATDLKIGCNLNRVTKQIVIDDVLETLDLSKTKETRCDRLSGGQRKRLSIALELVDNPPVMFLDEPTTGLDSSASAQCVAMLQNLASSGRTVVCTIHQPSAVIYELFDHIFLLAEGRCIYQGNPLNTVPYLSKLGLNCPKYHNPADYMIEVCCKEYGDFNDRLALAALDRSWRSSSKVKSTLMDDSNVSRFTDEGKIKVLINTPSEITRFWVLLHRCVLQMLRDWTITHLKLALHFLVGVLLGLLYSKFGNDGSKTISNMGFLIISTVYLCYTSMMPAVLKFPTELPVLRKEQFNNWYKLRTYYAAFLLIHIPVQILYVVVYSSLAYFLSNQVLELQRFLMFLTVLILTSLIAESFGLVLGTTVNPVNGTFIGAVSTCVMILFAGFLVLFNHMPSFLKYLSFVSYLRYSLEALAQAIYGFGRAKLDCPSGAEELNYCHYRIPDTVLKEFSMQNASYWLDVGILVSNFLILRVIGYCTLKKKLSPS